MGPEWEVELIDGTIITGVTDISVSEHGLSLWLNGRRAHTQAQSLAPDVVYAHHFWKCYR